MRPPAWACPWFGSGVRFESGGLGGNVHGLLGSKGVLKVFESFKGLDA